MKHCPPKISWNKKAEKDVYCQRNSLDEEAHTVWRIQESKIVHMYDSKRFSLIPLKRYLIEKNVHQIKGAPCVYPIPNVSMIHHETEPDTSYHTTFGTNIIICNTVKSLGSSSVYPDTCSSHHWLSRRNCTERPESCA